MLYELKSVSVYYDSVPALNLINLGIEPGKSLLVSGHNGAGKTTLLRLLYSDIMPSDGSIFFKSQNFLELKKKKRRLLRQITGIIEQEPKFIGHLTCFENVAVPLLLNGFSYNKTNKTCLETFVSLQISHLRTKYPHELSHGEKKNLAIARAIIHSPEIIIADEPFESLDQSQKGIVINLFNKLVEKGTTLILTSPNRLLPDEFINPMIINLADGKIISDEI